MVHYYVYYKKPNGDVYFECSCGTPEGADDRVAELKKRGHEAWHQTTHYPGAFYCGGIMSGMADQYPEEMDVDWASFASRAKTILLDRGIRHHYYDVLYEDELVEIVFLRKYDDRSLLQVTRKAMPDHHKEQLRRVSNPVYMEVLGECIRTHGEGRYIYKHMIDLSQRVI